MRKVFVFISIVAIATLFSSCATIVAGMKEDESQ